MHIEPPAPPALTLENVKHLARILEVQDEYAEATGRDAREDTELLFFLLGMEDDLTVTSIEALITLSGQGFRLYGDVKREEYYYDATRDYVADSVEKAGLHKPEEEYDPGDTYTGPTFRESDD